MQTRVRGAIEALPVREQRVISLYYYAEVTMKEIGAELGVNESRVSQLHARAIKRLRESLGGVATPAVATEIRGAILAFAARPKMKMVKAHLPEDSTRVASGAARRVTSAVVVPYDSVSRAARRSSPSRNGLDSHLQPVSSRKRSASVPATSPVTKMTRRASAGAPAAMAR